LKANSLSVDPAGLTDHPGEFGDVRIVGELGGEALGADGEVGQAGALRPRAAAAAQDFGVLRDDDIRLVTE
jgi:hypothetical protein